MASAPNPGKRIKGGRGDDTLFGTTGDDTINGGEGIDTLVIDASIYDYTLYLSGSQWVLHDDDYRFEDTGRDFLSSIEFIQFNDVTVDLRTNADVEITGPDKVYVTVGEAVSARYTFQDVDNAGGVSSEYGEYLPWFASFKLIEKQTGGSAFFQEMELIVDSGQIYGAGATEMKDTLAALAQGEEFVDHYTISYTTRLDPNDILYDRFEMTVDVVFVGVNDAPEIIQPAEAPRLWTRKGGAVKTIDLTQFADDIDSDDGPDDLTYELGWVTKDFDVWIEGTTLFYAGAEVPVELAADEVRAGVANVRVFDSHGEKADGFLQLELSAGGFDEKKTIVVSSEGLDTGALGISASQAVNVGRFWATEMVPGQEALLDFTTGDDVLWLRGYDIAGFGGRAGTDVNGNVLIDSAIFNTKAGNDVLYFDLSSEGGGVIGLTDIFTGNGEDVVAITSRGTSSSDTLALVNGVDINTGKNSDQVLIHLDSDLGGWIAGTLKTGSGADVVEIYITDPDKSDGGHAFSDMRIVLGTGDDRLTKIIDTGPAFWQAAIKDNIAAGEGNDTVYLSNVGSSIRPPNESLYDGPEYDDLFSGGLQADVFMGKGRDKLTVAFNDAYRSESVGGLHGGDGWDTLVLEHLVNGEASFEQVGDAIILTDGLQTIEITGFERIWLGDDTDVFALL